MPDMADDQVVLIQRGAGRRAQSLTVHVPSNAQLLAAALELKAHANGKRCTYGIYGTECVVMYTPPRRYTKTQVNPFTGERGEASEGTLDEHCCFYHWDGRLTFLGSIRLNTDPPEVRFHCKPALAEQLELFSAAEPEAGIEGRATLIELTRYERDPMLRALCIAQRGAACAVCGLTFAAAYGDVANGFIHIHHLEPLSAVRQAHEVDPTNDLIPVCPNCHAVIHLRTPPFTPDELRAMLRRGDCAD